MFDRVRYQAQRGGSRTTSRLNSSKILRPPREAPRLTGGRASPSRRMHWAWTMPLAPSAYRRVGRHNVCS